jgi:adenylate kinase
MKLILLGAPASGKGTQAERLSQKIELAHIASGDLFREAAEKGTELGIKVRSYMERGELVPDEITIAMIMERLSQPDSQRGFILDGFPRTLKQAEALDEALTEKGQTIDKVIYIKVSPEELLHRISGRWICRQCQSPYHLINSPPKVAGKCDYCGGELYQRPDDTRETAQKRLEVYFNQTQPLIDYYQNEGKLIEVDGEQGIDIVNQELMEVLGNG